MVVSALFGILAGLAASAAEARVVVDAHTVKRFGIVPPPVSLTISARSPRSLLATPQASSCPSPCPLTLHSASAPVQHAESEYVFFWDPGGSMSASYKSSIQTWLNDVAGADYTAGNPISVTQQYYDKSVSGGAKSYVPYAVR